MLEIDIDPKDASDVFTGDPVSIKVDALPFQQFGDIDGTLVYISDDTVEESLQGESGADYRGRVDVEDSEILGLPEDFDLTPGMLASADLKVGKSFLNETYSSLVLYYKDKDKIWIIDPIDGTTNFLHGIPHFAISIALKIDDEIQSALIHDPIKNEIFFAEKNNGAYFNNQRIRVSKKREINECLFAV